MSETAVSKPLYESINLLGTLLGECIAEAEGHEFFEKIEEIRALAKSTRSEKGGDYQALASCLNSLSNEELLPVARAFRHFLNLSNIADQHHVVSREMDDEMSATQTLCDTFAKLVETGKTPEQIKASLGRLRIELVLTAHPTEIMRRSLINKHTEIDSVLSQLELNGHTEREQAAMRLRLAELIAQIWHTPDFREHRPTPVDEAKWGFAVIENSLWNAVPSFLRRLDSTSNSALGDSLPLDYAPLSFAFWMGSDRDGNPNVTAKITREVMLLSRWKALDLYLKDIQTLIDELSMHRCNAEVNALAPGQREPYRHLLRQIRVLLQHSLEILNAASKMNHHSMAKPYPVLINSGYH